MKIVFLSNYYNHHQSALSDALFRKTNGNYVFIQTMPIEQERIAMGWGEELPSYVKLSYMSEHSYNECLKDIFDADVVIVGSAPEKMICSRIRANKLTFRYSERKYKNTLNRLQLPLRFIKYHWCNFSSKNTYLLCAGAHVARDFAKTGTFLGKTYKWGYFPEAKKYDDVDILMNSKSQASILWVARLIKLKHPEMPIQVAQRLKRDGYDFHMKIIGIGPLEDEIRAMIMDSGLSENVSLIGATSPKQVRKNMEESKIFLFTSDNNEGWGAVLNEAMNSGCAVVASHAIGSVPFLLDNGVNGFIYKNGDIDDLYKKTKRLLDDEELAGRFGRNAYETIVNTWNAEVAAERFIKLTDYLRNGESAKCLFLSGPCSIAGRKKQKCIYFEQENVECIQ